MSRFYTSNVNSRGNLNGRVIPASTDVHTRGWNAGVKVVPVGVKGELDRFEIYMTGGGHGEAASNQLLGEVRETPEGPLFFPAACQYANGKVYRFDGSN